MYSLQKASESFTSQCAFAAVSFGVSADGAALGTTFSSGFVGLQPTTEAASTAKVNPARAASKGRCSATEERMAGRYGEGTPPVDAIPQPNIPGNAGKFRFRNAARRATDGAE